MERKDVPPPYDSGMNPGYGQAYSNIASAPQPSSFNASSEPVMAQPQFTSNISTSVVIESGAPGGCPCCRNKSWTGTYSCCAWLWCLCCFPCGIIICLCMRRKKCTKCGFTVA